ncbi:MAG: (2Fe-2S)-binding protein [Deltaproteobacteria bacterium]|nr:(2Fe-2S)-binding protein [Deltaproteobacteria bacterium]
MDKINVTFSVNKDEVSLLVKPYETLLETLRDNLSLTGVKEACGLGACGSCTVLLNGQPVRSCLLLTPEVEGQQVTTIEGIGEGKALHPVQKAFMDEGAVQCGFCTPGMILTGKSLLDRSPGADREEVVRNIASNLCRCTGYAKIISAVMAAAEETDR